MNKICLCIGSKDFFGAERRYAKILRRILTWEEAPDIYLAVNSSLYLSSRDKNLPKSIFDDLDKKGRLIVLPESIRHVRLTKNLLKFISLFFSNAAFHCLLRADIVAYARTILSRRTILELTSPDVAVRIAKKVPSFFINRISTFACVSVTVEQKFLSEIKLRGVEGGKVRMHVWGTPYFDGAGCEVSKKKKMLVSACRFIRRKNVPLLAKSIAGVIDRLPEWEFFIFGQGEQQQEIVDALEKWIERGRVHVGYSDNTLSALAESSIYVSLIEPDNYPSQSILEAMACGNAILLSNTGVSSNFISDRNPNGILVDLSEGSISEAILRMCADEKLLAEMQASSAEYVRREYSPDVFIKEFLHLNKVSVTKQLMD